MQVFGINDVITFSSSKLQLQNKFENNGIYSKASFCTFEITLQTSLTRHVCI